MNITIDYYLEQINKTPNKKDWRCRYFSKMVDLEISNYRLTARKFRGTVVGQYCSRMSNYLEKRLNYSLGKGIN